MYCYCIPHTEDDLLSQRTYEDMKLLQLEVGEENFDIQLIVREWCPELLPEWEFRGKSHTDKIQHTDGPIIASICI